MLPGSHRDAAVGFERAALYAELEKHGEYVPESVIAADGEPSSTCRAQAPRCCSTRTCSTQYPNSSDADSPPVAWHYIPSDATMAFRGTDFSREVSDRHGPSGPTDDAE